MTTETVSHTAPLWRWTGSNGVSWHFVTIDGEAGEHLAATEAMRRLELGTKRGFRSLKVSVRIRESKWKTSCFPGFKNDAEPDGERGWLLPIKAAIRKAEGISEGDSVNVELEFL